MRESTYQRCVEPGAPARHWERLPQDQGLWSRPWATLPTPTLLFSILHGLRVWHWIAGCKSCLCTTLPKCMVGTWGYPHWACIGLYPAMFMVYTQATCVPQGRSAPTSADVPGHAVAARRRHRAGLLQHQAPGRQVVTRVVVHAVATRPLWSGRAVGCRSGRVRGFMHDKIQASQLTAL